jgi:hypothetical protein
MGNIRFWSMLIALISFSFFFILTFFLPTYCTRRGLLLRLITFSHTHTLGWNPLDEGSVRRRNFNLTMQHSEEPNSHAPDEIRARSPNK